MAKQPKIVTNFDPAKVDELPPGRHALGHLSLMLEVDAKTGRRAWVQKLSIDGRQRWITLGKAGEVKFRAVLDAAEQNRAAARRGVDPTAERRAARQEQERTGCSVADVLKAFREAREPGLAPRTVTSMRQRHALIERDDFGRLPIATLTGEQVADFLKKHWTRAPATASKMQRGLAACWSFAATIGWADADRASPCAWAGRLEHVLPAPRKVRAPVPQRSLPWEQAPAFWSALSQQSGIGAAALRLTLLCGTRTVETLGAQWSEIDLAAREWRIPAERMKMRRGFTVPLSDPAVAVLQEMAATRRGPFVFPSFDARRPQSNMSMLSVLGRMGMRDRMSVHGTRAMLRSFAAAHDVPREVGEALLAHSPPELTRVYQRDGLFGLLLVWWTPG